VLVDVRHTPPGTPVGPDVLASVGERLQPGAVVLLVTGWDRHWGESGYLDHPHLSPAAAQVLVDAGIRTVGVAAADQRRRRQPGASRGTRSSPMSTRAEPRVGRWVRGAEPRVSRG
jgi:arylformamidase